LNTNKDATVDNKKPILNTVDSVFEKWKNSEPDRANDPSRTLPETLYRLKTFLSSSRYVDITKLNKEQEQTLQSVSNIIQKILDAMEPKYIPGHAPTSAEKWSLTPGGPAQAYLSA